GVAGQDLTPAVAFALILEDPVQEAVPRRGPKGRDEPARPQRPLGDQPVHHPLVRLVGGRRLHGLLPVQGESGSRPPVPGAGWENGNGRPPQGEGSGPRIFLDGGSPELLNDTAKAASEQSDRWPMVRRGRAGGKG